MSLTEVQKQLNTENEFLKSFIDRNRINLEATETRRIIFPCF
ncbi:hypothetical protein AHF37_06604 [Paragonimus kellicotti]|nr:hypothetical protein AHF37_06604 [Paragonimus kellicotti]